MAVIYIYPYKIYKIYIYIYIYHGYHVLFYGFLSISRQNYLWSCAGAGDATRGPTGNHVPGWNSCAILCILVYICIHVYMNVVYCIYMIYMYIHIYIYNVYIYDIIYILRILNISVLLVNSHRFRLTGSPVGKTLNPVLRPLLVRRLPQFGLKNQDKKNGMYPLIN